MAEGKIQVSGTGMPSCSEARTSRKMDIPFIELGDWRKSRFEEGNRKPRINSRKREIHVACWPHPEVGSSKILQRSKSVINAQAMWQGGEVLVF